MTWSAKVVADGIVVEPGMNACSTCKHVKGCQIPKAVQPIATLLTGIDTRCDGTWANGDAELKCHAYEVEATKTTEGVDGPDGGTEPDGDEDTRN